MAFGLVITIVRHVPCHVHAVDGVMVIDGGDG